MAHKCIVLLTFFVGNDFYHGEASPNIKALSLGPWYCYRLVPAFITSAVTPCTYPCLLLSPHEHPHIVVHPEPNGTPCPGGTCRGSVCRTTSPNAILKRKKRFIGLYSIIKLIKEKKSLKELKKEMLRLRNNIAASSPAAVDNVGGRGIGASGIIRSGAGRVGLNIGNQGNQFGGNHFAATGRRGSQGNSRTIIINLGDLLRDNRGIGGNSPSIMSRSRSGPVGLIGRFNRPRGDGSGISTATFGGNGLLSTGPRRRDGRNGITGRVAGGRLVRIGDASFANRVGGITAGSEINSVNPLGNDFVSRSNGLRPGGNAISGSVTNIPLLETSSSRNAGNIGGSILSVPGVGDSSRGPLLPAFPGSSNVASPNIRDVGRDDSGTGLRANRAGAIHGLGSSVSRPGNAGGNIGNPVISTGSIGGRSSSAGRASYGDGVTNALRTGASGIGALGFGTTGGPNFPNSVVRPTAVGDARGDSTVISGFSRNSNANVGNSAANDAVSATSVFSTPGGSLRLRTDGNLVNHRTASTTSDTRENENVGSSTRSASLFEVDNV
ncbi:uncharacterized protein LOC144165119 [Haemaphysalis longicornis]